MVKYDYPTAINTTVGMTDIFSYLDVVTLGWFSNLILFAVWFIVTIFYYKSKGDIAESLALSGFVTFIFCLILWLGGFASGAALTISITVAILSIAYLFFDKK